MKSITTKDSHLTEDRALRRKRKINSFIFFVILFTIIIGSIISVFIALKQEVDSESLSSSNPEKAIKAVCDLTPSPDSCFNSIWSLHTNFSTNLGEIKTTPSRIFKLSLRAAFIELLNLITSNQIAISKVKDSRTLSALKGCDVLIRDSYRLINMSVTTMGVEPDDKIFKIAKIVRDLEGWMSNSTQNMHGCLTVLTDNHEGLKNGEFDLERLKMKILDARGYVVNSSVILAKMETIFGMFNQPIFAGIIDYDLRYDFGMVLYCLQFLVLLVLICMVLRL